MERGRLPAEPDSAERQPEIIEGKPGNSPEVEHSPQAEIEDMSKRPCSPGPDDGPDFPSSKWRIDPSRFPGSSRRRSIRRHSLSSSDRRSLVLRTLPGIQSLPNHPYSTQLDALNSLTESGPTSSLGVASTSTTSSLESMLWEPMTVNERRLEPSNSSSVPALLLRLSDPTLIGPLPRTDTLMPCSLPSLIATLSSSRTQSLSASFLLPCPQTGTAVSFISIRPFDYASLNNDTYCLQTMLVSPTSACSGSRMVVDHPDYLKMKPPGPPIVPLPRPSPDVKLVGVSTLAPAPIPSPHATTLTFAQNVV